MSTIANLLSVARALLAVPLVVALSAGEAAAALAVWAAAVATDVLDGRMARRDGRARGRRLGAYLDVAGDAVFLLSGLTVLWTLGALPGWVPLLSVAMLARFFATSPSTGLVYDPVGRHYGTILYGVLGLWILGAPPGVRGAVLAALAVASIASLVGRSRYLAARTLRARRRAPGGPDRDGARHRGVPVSRRASARWPGRPPRGTG